MLKKMKRSILLLSITILIIGCSTCQNKNDSKNELELKNGCFLEKLIVGKINDENYKKLSQNYANYELYINMIKNEMMHKCLSKLIGYLNLFNLKL